MAKQSLVRSWMTKTARRFGYVSKAEAEYMAADQRAVQRMDTAAEKVGSSDWRGGLTTMTQLRYLAKACDVVANAIQLRIDQVRGTPLEIVPLEGIDESEAESEIEQGREFLRTEGGLGGPGITWQEFVCSAIYDMLSIGATCGYRRQTKAGDTFAFELVDAASIKPILTSGGWVPQPPEIAFEQYNLTTAQKVGEFTADEIRYLRYNSALTSRYGRSPTENVLVAILQYLSYDVWNLSWATTGDADFTYWEVPQEWDVKQIEQFGAFINALNSSTAGKQAQASKPIPAGPKRVKERPIKEASFERTQVHLVRRIARAFGLNATVLGFEGAQYKVSQDTSIEQAVLWGEDVTKLLLANLITDILQDDLGLTKVRAVWQEPDADKQPIAQTLQTAGTRYIPINEGREMLGLPALEGPYVDAAFESSPMGPIVLGWRPDAKPPEEAGPGPEPEPEQTEPAPEEQEAEEPVAKSMTDAAAKDLKTWERKALKFWREGHLSKAVGFTSDAIPADIMRAVAGRLAVAKTESQVRDAFETGNGQAHLTEAVATELLAAVRAEQAARAN